MVIIVPICSKTIGCAAAKTDAGGCDGIRNHMTLPKATKMETRNQPVD